ncbi:MAG: histidine kinase [Micropruina sp.]|uniref:sensor histidine kinase n=1 Tax=Micropruina sp. TaxID=2737536 RepID=UPI0039E6435F
MNRRPGSTSVALTIVGAALLAWWTVIREFGHQPTWALILFAASLLCWVGRTMLARIGIWRAGTVLAASAVPLGAVAASATHGNSLIPTAVCLLILVGDAGLPLTVGLTSGLAALALIGLGALIDPVEAATLASMLGVPAVAALAGFSRRQGRQAERREAMLAEREVAMREEAIRVALARDLHDVLAHTLGGLVVQLDAAEALLEAGRPDAARERVTGARSLAASGLGEARRAVAALRAPASAPEQRTPEQLSAALEDLLDVHRALGGTVEWSRTGTPTELTGEQAAAVERALQESLSNARRHAPGAPVTAAVAWHDDRVVLTVSNSVPDAPCPEPEASRGVSPGYGLIGMRERFEALPLGGSVNVTEGDGRFTVRAEAMLR